VGQCLGGARIRSRCWLPGDGWSGGGVEGDLVAEGFQLADVVALDAFGTGAGVVEAGTEVVEPGLWVGQQVPGDDQDGPADRDDRSLLAASTGDPPVAFPQEGIGLPSGDGSCPVSSDLVHVSFELDQSTRLAHSIWSAQRCGPGECWPRRGQLSCWGVLATLGKGLDPPSPDRGR
jgi:hypothetical protein